MSLDRGASASTNDSRWDRDGEHKTLGACWPWILPFAPVPNTVYAPPSVANFHQRLLAVRLLPTADAILCRNQVAVLIRVILRWSLLKNLPSTAPTTHCGILDVRAAATRRDHEQQSQSTEQSHLSRFSNPLLSESSTPICPGHAGAPRGQAPRPPAPADTCAGRAR
jgi:hypothetical protein